MRQTDTIFQQMYWLMTDGNNYIIACLVMLVIIAILLFCMAIGIGTACDRLTKIQRSLTVLQKGRKNDVAVKK